jgi:hypothetical protein
MKRGLVLILVFALGAALWVTIALILFGPDEPRSELTSTAEIGYFSRVDRTTASTSP